MAIDTPIPSPVNAKRRWVFRAAVGLSILALVGVTLICLGVQSSLTAERNLHAMLDAIDACHRFVEQHDGAWPHSDEDLKSLYSDDREWIPRDAVHIDFNADPSLLSQQDWQSFTGITVEQPVYFSYESRLTLLINLLRYYQEGIEEH